MKTTKTRLVVISVRYHYFLLLSLLLAPFHLFATVPNDYPDDYVPPADMDWANEYTKK